MHRERSPNKVITHDSAQFMLPFGRRRTSAALALHPLALIVKLPRTVDFLDHCVPAIVPAAPSENALPP